MQNRDQHLNNLVGYTNIKSIILFVMLDSSCGCVGLILICVTQTFPISQEH